MGQRASRRGAGEPGRRPDVEGHWARRTSEGFRRTKQEPTSLYLICISKSPKHLFLKSSLPVWRRPRPVWQNLPQD